MKNKEKNQEKIMNGLAKVAFTITTLSMGAVLSGLVVQIVGAKESNDVVQKFVDENQDYYAANVNKDVQALSESFANGEITKDEYEKQLDYYSSNAYITQLMKKYEVENKLIDSPYVEDAIKGRAQFEAGFYTSVGGIGVALSIAGIAFSTAIGCAIAEKVKEGKELKRKYEKTEEEPKDAEELGGIGD